MYQITPFRFVDIVAGVAIISAWSKSGASGKGVNFVQLPLNVNKPSSRSGLASRPEMWTIHETLTRSQLGHRGWTYKKSSDDNNDKGPSPKPAELYVQPQ